MLYCTKENRKIIVHNQEELNNIPTNFKGQIYIDSNPEYRGHISIWESFSRPIIIKGTSKVFLYSDDITAIVKDYANVYSCGATIHAYDCSAVVSFRNSYIDVHDQSYVLCIKANIIEAYDNSYVYIEGKINGVNAYDNARIFEKGNIKYLTLCCSSKRTKGFENLKEYMDFYGIKSKDEEGIFYTTTVKDDKQNDYYIYNKIHVTGLQGCMSMADSFNNMTILECKVKLKDILVPSKSEYVWAVKAEVIREVPKEEWANIIKEI